MVRPGSIPTEGLELALVCCGLCYAPSDQVASRLRDWNRCCCSNVRFRRCVRPGSIPTEGLERNALRLTGASCWSQTR